MQSVFAREVRSFVVTNFFLDPEEEFNDDDSFLGKRLIDSTGILELVCHLEETYGIEITDDELNPDNLDSINKIDAYLSRKLPSRNLRQHAATQEPFATN